LPAPQAARKTETGDAPAQLLADGDGAPHLTGARHPLTAATAARLRAPLAPAEDHSAVQWSVLVAAALARYRLADAREWLADPDVHAMEHARSRRSPGSARREPRPVAEQEEVLRRQWSALSPRRHSCPAVKARRTG